MRVLRPLAQVAACGPARDGTFNRLQFAKLPSGRHLIVSQFAPSAPGEPRRWVYNSNPTTPMGRQIRQWRRQEEELQELGLQPPEPEDLGATQAECREGAASN